MDNWITTHTGKEVEPFNLKVEDIDILDIAHSLSHICRFNGHCSKHYSVAQHSLFVMDLVSPENKLVALLHDATEAYMGDFPTPIKAQLPFYKEKEHEAWQVIAEKYGLPTEIPAEVKHADKVALRAEKEMFIKPGGKPWKCLELVSVNSEAVEKLKDCIMNPYRTRRKFLIKFKRLRGQG